VFTREDAVEEADEGDEISAEEAPERMR